MKGETEITYNPDNEYVIQLKKKQTRWYWWLLLLLLPLLLLIELDKTVIFRIVESEDTKPVSNSTVIFSYDEQKIFDFDKQKFNTETNITLEGVTDSVGLAVFNNVSYTLYSYLFFHKTKALIVAGNNCFASDSIKPYFHDINSNEELLIKLPIRTTTLEFKVIDKDDNQPLPDANVSVSINLKNDTLFYEKKTSPAGFVTLENLPVCAFLNIKATYNGYKPAKKSGETDYFVGDFVERTLKLSPEKTILQFIVKDLNSKQPLPGAKAMLFVDNKAIASATTNTNGVGKGAFDDINASVEFTIKGQKQYYADTTLTAVAKDFTTLLEAQRTLLLRPLKENIIFRNITSQGAMPIVGAKNEITVNGKKRSNFEYSNANGTFIVSGIISGDKIDIVASKSGFKTNTSTIKRKTFSDLMKAPIASRNIPMDAIQTSTTLRGGSGDMRINLQWNTIDDLDLFVTDPCGNTIWALELSHTCRAGKGILDIDANTNRYPPSTYTNTPQENIFWEKPTKGNYIIAIEYCSHQSNHTGAVPFNITVVENGVRKDFSGTVREKEKKNVATYEVK